MIYEAGRRVARFAVSQLERVVDLYEQGLAVYEIGHYAQAVP